MLIDEKKTALITIVSPISYVTRFTFIDGREGSLRPETGSVELSILHEVNTPMKQTTAPFVTLVGLLNNRFLLDSTDPILYSGLLEPKNGRSIQEYYNEVVLEQSDKYGLWFSEDNSVPRHTLGGISLAVLNGPATVENLAYRITSYLDMVMKQQKLYTEYLPAYKSIKFNSSNKSATFAFEDL